MATTASTRRDEILDTVDRLLGELGYGKLSVQDIAAAAGISRRTFYGYFPGKEAATLACLDRSIERLVQQLREVAQQQRPAAERLREMLRLRVKYLHEVSRHRHHANDEIYGQLRPLYMPRRERYLDAEGSVFRRVLAEGHTSGELRCDRPAETARLLLVATNAFMPFNLSPEQLRRPKSIRSQLDRLIHLLLCGLSASRSDS